ncbi:Cytochrome b561 and DOMON domain-containing protein [Pseudocercospora fuligena]|uniref:Cytochrome b561 and DOMON domain-containing protein n=1 Tax=Pseudocercospora fuligena TaxID=685502 RepID=A0A8H6VGY7_9PEZI|nr:Cytochrome b561 and DOMON domain-containing protein [Pseudocercospora fuligena]
MKTTLYTDANGRTGLTAYAQSIAKTCPESDICYSLNIPESTASSGNGDIFFQLSAPTTYAWVALGQGSSMSGSNIFVMYTSADGKNVTVSPRLGTGHVEPQHDTDAQVELLEGSGVTNGKMIANMRCSNCNSWSGGKMDFTGSSSDWIYAYKSGDSMNSDDLSASISRHDNASPFTWNMASAKGGDSVNPFVSGSSGTATSSGGSTATSSCIPRPTSGEIASPSGSGYSGSSSNGDTGSATFENNGAPFGGDYEMGDRIISAHGALASLAFVGLFPIGGILIRIANFTGLIWVHAVMQAIAYLIYIVAFGMGAYLMSQLRNSITIHAHPIIGGVLFLVLLSQPISGFLHHRLFKKYGRRTGWSYAHLSIGRIAIPLGMINGGLGLALAGAGTGAKAAYAVVAVIMALAYIASIVIGERRRRNNQPPTYGQATRLKDERDAPIALTEHFGKGRS